MLLNKLNLSFVNDKIFWNTEPSLTKEKNTNVTMKQHFQQKQQQQQQQHLQQYSIKQHCSESIISVTKFYEYNILKGFQTN